MSKPIDRRIEKSRERILEAAQLLLAESGIGGFTVDEVSRRSGVAKTTIYRQWPSRETLVLDAASRVSAAETVPDSGSLAADLTAFLRRLAELLTTARWSSIVPSLVDVAERDDEFAALHGGIQRGHADPLRQILARAQERGDLAVDVDHETIVSTLIGPLYYRRWFSRESISDDLIDFLVASVPSVTTSGN